MDTSNIEDFLECCICLEQLDEKSKVLPCQHTFCVKCLNIVVESKGHLQCPECRSDYRQLTVNELPRNVLLIRILEGLKTKRNSIAASEGGKHRQDEEEIKATSSENLKTSKRLSAKVKCDALLNQPSVRGLYSFTSGEDGDLSFCKGDIISLLHEIDDNWLEGILKGKRGSIPKNFVEILVPLPKIDDDKNTKPFAKALYTFESKEEQELISFKEGDIIPVIKKVDDNWLEGVLGSQYGIFPVNFMKLNKAGQDVMTAECSSSSGSASGSSSDEDENKQRRRARRSAKNKKPSSSSTRARVKQQQQHHQIVRQHSENLLSTKSIPTTTEQNKRHTIHVENPQEHRRQSRRALNLSDELDAHQRERTQSQGRRASETSVQHERTLASTVLLGRALRNSDDQLTCIVPTTLPISMTTSMSSRSDVTLTFSSSPPTSNCPSPLGAGETYTALFTYSPAQDDELALIQGDHYNVIEKHLDGWYKGVHLRSRQSGVFPGNYVKPSNQVTAQMLRNAAASPSRNVIGYGSNPSSPSAIPGNTNAFSFPPRGPETPNGGASPRRNGEGSSPSRSSGFGLLKMLKKNKSKRPTPPTPLTSTPTNEQAPPSYYHSSMPAPAHHRLSRPSPMVPAEPPPPYTPSVIEENISPIIQTNSTPTLNEKFRVIVTYERMDSRELTLEIGDIIYVTKKHTDGWYAGKSTRTGATGLFPSIFVEPCL